MTIAAQTRDVYSRVTTEILEAMERGVLPWLRPWAVCQSRNAISGNPYRGINVLTTMLHQLEHGHASSEYLTYRQATDLGGAIKQHEHGATVVYFNRIARPPRTAAEVAEGEEHYWWLAKAHTVFNLEQTVGLDVFKSRRTELERLLPVPALCETAVAAADVAILHSGNVAHYDVVNDIITLPPKSAFASPAGYASTLFHELVHATGAAHRLNRNLSGRFGDPRYAMEELIAELGAAFLAAQAGMVHVTEAAAYMASWIAALKGDRRAIFAAARWASVAADYLSAEGTTDLQT